MNAQRIRERWHRDTKPFEFRLSDGTRVRVKHPDLTAMPPGFGFILVLDRNGRETRFAPSRVVAIEEAARRKSTTSGSRRGEFSSDTR